MKKPLPIGVEFFKEFKKNDYYYVDKTLFIKELIDKKGMVNLFPFQQDFSYIQYLHTSYLGMKNMCYNTD